MAMRAPAIQDDRELGARVARLRHAKRLHILLDYDGTLVPFAPVPELAEPDEELLELLLVLSSLPGVQVHLLSGRPFRCMEAWFGHLPLALHAEDGYWSRQTPGGAWIAARLAVLDWKEAVLGILADLTLRTDGSFVERKTTSIAWHYRMTEPLLASERLSEARYRIKALKGRGGLELIDGPMVLEVRKAGVDKRCVLSTLGSLGCVLAAGDDSGDEQLFEALPPTSVAIHVGCGPTRARYSVLTPSGLRRALRALVPRSI
jgi:trehalose 6-phosphate synthase/phosphatase